MIGLRFHQGVPDHSSRQAGPDASQDQDQDGSYDLEAVSGYKNGHLFNCRIHGFLRSFIARSPVRGPTDGPFPLGEGSEAQQL